MNKNMRYKLREDKQDEFIENYEYANKDDCYYLKISKHLILDQNTLEIVTPTNKLEEEDIDLLAKLEANNMLEFYKKEDQMNKELALRTFGYLIGHYKTHNKTPINSQEIEAIEFILKDNEELEQQVKKQKEVIDKITEIINYYGIDKEHNDNLVLRSILKNMLNILKEVSE